MITVSVHSVRSEGQSACGAPSREEHSRKPLLCILFNDDFYNTENRAAFSTKQTM